VARNWICCQLGAREHYSVPRALWRTNRLAALYTDYWAGTTVRFLAGQTRTGLLQSMAARFHPDLERSPEQAVADGAGNRPPEIISWNWRAVWWEAMLRQKYHASGGSPVAAANGHTPHPGGPYHGFIEVGRRFAERVRDALQRRADLDADSIFFAYDTAALEALEWCQARGLKCILNQMDPGRVELELVRREEQEWPGWAVSASPVPEAYFVRREREWHLAARVLVNSEFSRQALIRQGVPAGKLTVIPLCYEANGTGRPAAVVQRRPDEPLRVLYLGQVILRKGIQYLLAAARQLERENVRFDVVGPVGISREAVATAPVNVSFHGRVGRGQAAQFYQCAHVFVLPTISDGFALTQLEAMAHGLPVITTPSCGEVVTDGRDGYVVPPRDAGALAQAFQRYLMDFDLLSRQSAAALGTARRFTFQRLAADLARLETDLSKA